MSLSRCSTCLKRTYDKLPSRFALDLLLCPCAKVGGGDADGADTAQDTDVVAVRPHRYCKPLHLTFFKVTLPLIPDFYQKSLRTKIRLKILELNSREKHFDPHSVLGCKTFRKHFFFLFFFDFPGYGRASRRVMEPNVDSRPKTQLNGAEAPFIFCSETQSWCVIKPKAQHSVRSLSEMRDHTQENKKGF